MSKLILLAFPVMYGVGLRNETRQGSVKNVFSCLLLNNLFKELRLSWVITNASCSFKIVSAGDWRTIDKHTGVYLTWQLQKVCVWMPSAAHTLTLMTRLHWLPQHHDTRFPHQCQRGTTNCYLFCGEHWHNPHKPNINFTRLEIIFVQ